ncbi:uncharacterized protein BDR25DRAFT_314693 [Lindgomyces ingoldianus]|uniref:Uncharacterized protein n=1 Tax=Lindgomyces ingoldianus TaxID=673940 RepID=A0ACB6QVI3_9PLEO|nr:uncharacterized protein BDR25DRAFT_314693 [Lindgomyces ingoldianus]KAF2470515.1 hypothetical protein BDR25DRAFT_314693 [Lindgomyces ingoldianus]
MYSILFTVFISSVLCTDPRILHLPKRSHDLPKVSLPCVIRSGTISPLFGSTNTTWASASECPPPDKLKKDAAGSCGPLKTPDCAAYCEEKTAWFYGREIEFPLQCQSNSKCTLTTTDTITVTNSYTVNVGLDGSAGDAKTGLLSALKVGFSYSYSVASAKAQGLSQTAPDGYCGYWTFIPMYWASYGSLTHASLFTSAALPFTGMVPTTHCNRDAVTKKVYNYKPVFDTSGNPVGETVFVKKNCVTHKKLCGVKQAPVYTQQFEPDLKDSTKGWMYTDDKGCEVDAGVAMPASAMSTTSALPSAPTIAVGAKCGNNGECDAGQICNSGRCAENTWKPTGRAM